MHNYSRKKIENREEVRSIKKTIRFNSEELKIAEEKIKDYNMPFGEFTRKLILGFEPVTKLESEFLIELRKIGTNINQIAKVLNSGNGNVIDIKSSWENIQKELKRLINNGS